MIYLAAIAGAVFAAALSHLGYAVAAVWRPAPGRRSKAALSGDR